MVIKSNQRDRMPPLSLHKFNVREIYTLCDCISPFATQESWDNSGLNLGSLESSCNSLVVCLELTYEIALRLSPKTLVITHHPLFFRPLKNFIYESYPANIAQILIQKECCVLSLHTNFDKSHLNAYLTHQVLGFSHFKTDDNELMMQGKLEPVNLTTLAQQVKQKIRAPLVNFVKAEKDSKDDMISYAYVVCGSGCSLMYDITHKDNVCLITADIKHHDAMIAKSMGLSLIDMGHYESEKYFVQIFDSILQNEGYNAIITDCKNPFCFC